MGTGLENLEVLCFGDNDWWYHNRGHMDIQLMKRYAKMGRVLYVNSVIVRNFNIREGTMFLRRVKRKLASMFKGMKPSGVKNMTVYSPISIPVHNIGIARELNQIALRLQIRQCMNRLNMSKPIVWVACPGAAEAAVKLPNIKLVYQRSDRYEMFPGVDVKRIKRYDELLKEHADLVIYANRELFRLEQFQCRKAVYLDHGLDYHIFANADQDNDIPEEMGRIPHPILGFYGNIDNHTSNIALVEQVAELLPDISIVLVGNSSVDLSALASRKNIYLLSQKPYEQIPHYAKCFDVCFMPWQQNEWIAACNPVKLKEYLALGRPIVSTPFPELNNYKGLIEVASDAASFAQAVRKACNEDDPKLISTRRKRVSNCTWNAKAEQILLALHETN